MAALAAIAIAVSKDGGEGAGSPAAATDRGQPNIVVLMADDLGLAAYERALPRTRELLGAGGTELTEAIVATPLCCPSRAALLSGRYGHNNGVLANAPGYPALEGKRQVLPVWLRRAGYRTALVGKFKNGYDGTARGVAGRPAPGWDEWVEMRRTFGYYDYELNVNGTIEARGGDREDYLTDVLTEHAVAVVRRATAAGEPLFLWLSWWAPHPEGSGRTPGPCRGSAIPAERAPGPFASERLPEVPSIDEDDVSDKPRFIRRRRDLRPGDRDAARMSFRCRLASLEAIDRGVEAIRAALDEAGELGETAFVFTSDNGFLHLEHRLPEGKGLPYEEAIRVPLLVDLPPRLGEQPPKASTQVSNIDLAPTLLEIAGAEPCRRGRCATLDGLSLLPLLRGGEAGGVPERALLVEAADGRPCPFAAVRTRHRLYAEHSGSPGEKLCRGDGERELYDLAEDPHQLENLLAGPTPDPPAGSERRLRRLLGRLRDCAGADPSPRPRGRPSCTIVVGAVGPRSDGA